MVKSKSLGINTLKGQAYAFVKARGAATSPEIANQFWDGNTKKAEVTLYDLRASGFLEVRNNGRRAEREWFIPDQSATPSNEEVKHALEVIKRALGV